MTTSNKRDTRLGIFIDASNLWQAQKAKGKLFDYAKLKSFLKQEFNAEETLVSTARKVLEGLGCTKKE